jgi:myo-inositol-1(or 4)-monophosphatase
MPDKVRQIAVIAAMSAGAELLRRYLKYDRRDQKFKSPHEIVTSADIASERIIWQTIKKNLPEHEILSEEAGRSKIHSDYLWVVDPLDGTHNFSCHNPLWAISIAVFHKGDVILGVIFAPFLNELYVAEKGQGAFLNGRPIQVSKIKGPRAMNAVCSSSKNVDIKRMLKYYNYHKLRDLDIRQLGSAALEMAYTAAGRLESIYIPGAHAWDVGAGVLLVREAGGKATDKNNKPWNLKSQEIIASNSVIHADLMKVLKKIK